MSFTWLKLFPHILPFQVNLQAILKWTENISITDPVVTALSPFPLLWQTADWRGHHWPLKETWKTAGWLSCFRLQDRTCQFCTFTTASQFYWLKSKTHMTTRVLLGSPIFILHIWCNINYCILQRAISKCWHISEQNSSVTHVEKVVDGDLATFILWAPDFGPSNMAEWKAVLPLQRTRGFEKTGNFWKIIMLMNSLSMYNTKN